MRRVCPSSIGFTLMEMVVVIVILGIIASVGAIVMRDGFLGFRRGQEIVRADWQGRIALERMERELRTVRSATAADLVTGVAGQVTFTNTSGTVIVYRRNAATSQLERSQDGGTTFQPLADFVSSLSFSYWQSDGITSTATATLVYYISAQITVSTTNVSASLRSTVKPAAF